MTHEQFEEQYQDLKTQPMKWIDRLPKPARIAIYIGYGVFLGLFLYTWFHLLCVA